MLKLSLGCSLLNVLWISFFSPLPLIWISLKNPTPKKHRLLVSAPGGGFCLPIESMAGTQTESLFQKGGDGASVLRAHSLHSVLLCPCGFYFSFIIAIYADSFYVWGLIQIKMFSNRMAILFQMYCISRKSSQDIYQYRFTLFLSNKI